MGNTNGNYFSTLCQKQQRCHPVTIKSTKYNINKTSNVKNTDKRDKIMDDLFESET